MTVNELRKKFIEFFNEKDHLNLKSFSLVPENDNSLLLINSGMAPMKPYFTGLIEPPKRRISSCQKCIRTGDIDNVGKTARHGTFFEMLGNFSFGDYFKEEAIEWTWEFLTKVIKLDENRLYPSVYMEDDEAYKIWNEKIGVPKERIFRLGKEDNFWEHGAGPCGPSSEVYYDRGIKYGNENSTVGSDDDRFMEIWNNVFTQFEGDGKGNYVELSQKNIDTGMGLERLAVVVQDVESIFEVDSIRCILDEVCKKANIKYKENEKKDISIRVITDHIRSITFMASDGIMPSNEGRGYVFRRLLRRASRHGKMLGIDELFLTDLSKIVIEASKDAYPELAEKEEHILKIIQIEEENFGKTIDQGLVLLSELENNLVKENKSILSGKEAFKLYDTYGFPLDLTIEILEEKGLLVDIKEFDECMKHQKDMARNARATTNYMGAEGSIYDKLDNNLITEFVGYDKLNESSKIIAITTTDIVEKISKGDEATIFVEKTPFYATSGGQEGDIGKIYSDNFEFDVKTTIKVNGDKIAHIGIVLNGEIEKNDTVKLEVNKENRDLSRCNHSATHLLHTALKNVLGSHVEQAGSLLNASKLRFDFTHFEAISKDKLKEIEDMVNEQINKNLVVNTKIMTIDEAKKTGATAIFGEKYDDVVRVVFMDDFCKDFCGGTHVSHTSEIKLFKILSETSVSAGVRRIEAITNKEVVKYYEELEKELLDIAKSIKVDRKEIILKLKSMQDELKELKNENGILKSKQALSNLDNIINSKFVYNDLEVIISSMKDVDMNNLRKLADNIKSKLKESIVVLVSEFEGKANIVITASKLANEKGYTAGSLIKEFAPIVGGGGGGRDNMAQAGGKEPENIDKLIVAVKDKFK